MKQSEKTELTKERILSAAFMEFGKNGYEGMALNQLCSRYGISKGLIYHNFKSKDDLYLRCVEIAFASLMDYVREKEGENDSKRYVELRYHFFSEHPMLSRIFFEAVLQPPKHLAAAIRLKKAGLDEMNLNIYKAALKKIKLRPGVNWQEAIAYYSIIQEMFNSYFSSPAYANTDFATMISEHENWLTKLFDFILYGIAQEDDA